MRVSNWNEFIQKLDSFNNFDLDFSYSKLDGIRRSSLPINSEFVILEKNIPNDPSLWKSCKNWAKSKYDVWPSAYACGAAAKRYKSKGGTWRKK